MTKRFLRYSGLGLAVLTVGAIAACGSSDDSGGPSSAAGSSAAGAHTGGAGGLPASGGLSGIAGATVIAGSSSGGAPTAGAAGTGTGPGGSGGAGVGFPCAGTKPGSASFTDFSDLVPNPTSAGNYTFMAGVPGGTFTYQPAALTLDITGMMLNVKGNIKGYDGFGVYTTTCTDASAYTGISFSIKGNPGASGTLSFRIQTNSDTAIDTVNKKGTCVVPPGTTDTYPVCHAPALDIPVTSAGGTVSVNFSQLAGGLPVDGLTGNEILGLEWAFTWNPPAAGTGGAGGAGAGAYDANITLDDIKFIGGSSGGAGGAGGASGAAGAGGASAGAGGASAGAGGSAAGSGGTAGH